VSRSIDALLRVEETHAPVIAQKNSDEPARITDRRRSRSRGGCARVRRLVEPQPRPQRLAHLPARRAFPACDFSWRRDSTPWFFLIHMASCGCQGNNI